MQEFLSADRSSDTTPLEINAREAKESNIDENFIDPKYIKRIKEESEISQFFKTRNILKSLYEDLFPYQWKDSFVFKKFICLFFSFFILVT